MPTLDPSPSDTAGPSVVPTPVVSASPCCSEPATAPAGLTELERSSMFWDPLLAPGVYGFDYTSLADISRGVHLVVRGRITGVTLDEFYDYGGDSEPLPDLLATVAVDEVLRGTPEMRTEGTIELSLGFPWAGWEDDLLVNVPDHDHLFFLMNDGRWREELGFAPRYPDDGRYRYMGPNYDQYVLRGIDDRVEVIEPQEGRFPAALDGERFEEIVDRVRQVAGE